MKVNTKNFPYTYFKFELDPTHNLTEDDPKQLIRFQFQTDQYIDFDTSYLELTISLADFDQTFPAGYTTASGTKYGLALDGPSTSLIQNFKLYRGGQLLEHIQEYHKIGQIMHQLNISAKQRDGKNCMGLGKGGHHNKFPDIDIQNASSGQISYQYATGHYQQSYSFGFSPSFAWYPLYDDSYLIGAATSFVGHNYTAPKFISNFTTGQQPFGYAPANRTPYAIWSRVYGGDYGIQKAGNKQYNFALQSIKHMKGNTSASYQLSNVDCRKIIERGYQVPFSPHLENLNKDVIIEPGVNKFLINNGKYQEIPSRQNMFVFKIPLLSSIIGAQRSGHQGLMDGRMLQQLHFEWRLNEYAFYATGLGSEDLTGGAIENQFKRMYKIKRCRMIFDTYHPSYTPSDALGPTEFWANAWTVGHIHSFNSTAELNADHQINVGIRSARLMLTYFNLCDYLDKSYCRQYYPISGNVTSYQVKMNSLLFPVNPVIGHSGNPFLSTDQQSDNTEFVDYFNRAMGTFMTGRKQIWTDNISFAPNERPYVAGNDVSTQNYEKTGGGSFFLEQKIPRVFYITRFDDQDGKFVRNIVNSNEYDYGWNGVDTTEYRPFTLSLRTDQVNYNNSAPIEMNILFYHDVYVRFSPEGVETQGLMLQ